MIERITLSRLLPEVFDGMQEQPRIASSQVWLREEVVIARGCRLAIEAESGGGKSSLLSFIYGARRDYLGTITFDSTPARHLSIARWTDLRRRSLALMPQDLGLFHDLTVMENIRLKNRLTGALSEKRIAELLDCLDIADKGGERVDRLSVGQQQRVAAIRAIAQPFDFLLLDEPVSHLDEARNRALARIFDEEASRYGAGIVTTSVGNHLLLQSLTAIKL